MKKVILSLVVVVAALSTASCKKNYTCTCTITAGGVSIGTTSSTIDDTKSKATSACTAMGTTVSSSGVSETSTCSIN